MSDTKISEAAVEAAISAYRSAFEWTDRLDRDAMRAALAAVLPYLHPQPAELSFDVEAMLTACVPGGNIVDPQVVADNIRTWFADRKPTELAEQQGDALPALPYPNYPISKTGLQNNLYTASQMQDYARAARQPVGQDDWFSIESAPKDGSYIMLSNEGQDVVLIGTWHRLLKAWTGYPTTSGQHLTWKTATHWNHLPAPVGTTRYAALPAKGIDLGQFRPFVEAQRAEYISHGLTEEDYCVAECDELLDLIDSQAVGNK